MRSKRSKLRSSGLAALVLAGSATVGSLYGYQGKVQVQDGVPQIPSASSAGRTGENERDNDPFLRRQREKQTEARNVQRQEQLVKDTQKLLALATELKAEVDKSSKDTLSIDVIKKAEEIEKLAKSVREKMRD